MTQDEYYGLELGQLVQLASGGPAMTVTRSHAEMVTATWIDGSNAEQVTLPFQCLVKVALVPCYTCGASSREANR